MRRIFGLATDRLHTREVRPAGGLAHSQTEAGTRRTLHKKSQRGHDPP